MSGTNHNQVSELTLRETGGPAPIPALPIRVCMNCGFRIVDLTREICPRCRVNLRAAEASARCLSGLRSGRLYASGRGLRVR